jgi:hypothetical protein
LAGPANNEYSDELVTLPRMNALAPFLGMHTYSKSGRRFKIPIETLCVLLLDGMVAVRGMSNVLADEPTELG